MNLCFFQLSWRLGCRERVKENGVETSSFRRRGSVLITEEHPA